VVDEACRSAENTMGSIVVKRRCYTVPADAVQRDDSFKREPPAEFPGY
jgi:hypothetical protein